MKENEFEELIKNNPEYKHSEKYNMYVNEDATLLYALNRRTWMSYQIHVDEYTGFRYINQHHKKISLLRVLQDAWGTDHKLRPLSDPPYRRDEFNKKRKEKRHNSKIQKSCNIL